jgi:hypothetical protein
MVSHRASLCFILVAITISVSATTNRLAFDSLPHARFEFTGPVGERIQDNFAWLGFLTMKEIDWLGCVHNLWCWWA